MAGPLITAATEAARVLQAAGCQALVADHRAATPGGGLLAWPGRVHDARQHVAAALAAGVRAALVEAEGAAPELLADPRVRAVPGLKALAGDIAAAFHGHPAERLTQLAVTGTNGKTSSAWWMAQGLTQLGRRCGVVGTLGIGEPGAGLLDTGLTTPDAVTLQAALARFVAQGFAACAYEASSIGLAEGRLAGTRPTVAVFTNLTQDHLDYHGSMAAYWAAKRSLFDAPSLRAAVINLDDAQGAGLDAELGHLDRWTFSLQGPARLRGCNLRHAAEGLVFDLLEGGRTVNVRTRVVGAYNASNLLGVIGAWRALGVPLDDAAATVPKLLAVPGRLQPVPAAQGPLVLVDYAHTPDALHQVLQALRPLAAARQGRLWCLFGCGGNRDAGKRPRMAAAAEALADRLVLTSDNPRHEPPAAILAQVVAGLSRPAEAAVIEDRAQAIAHAVRQAAPADVVLLAGKGHEAYQEVAGVRRPFDDVQVAAAALVAQAEGAAA